MAQGESSWCFGEQEFTICLHIATSTCRTISSLVLTQATIRSLFNHLFNKFKNLFFSKYHTIKGIRYYQDKRLVDTLLCQHKLYSCHVSQDSFSLFHTKILLIFFFTNLQFLTDQSSITISAVPAEISVKLTHLYL